MYIDQLQMARFESAHTTDCQDCAVSSKRECLGRFVQCNCTDQPARRWIPELKFVVLTAGNELLSIGGENRAGDTTFMTGHDDFFVRLGQIPNVYEIRIGRSKMCPVGA